ncbi:Sterile alpha motif (SAM) domain-containing protein [Zea mays]|uniref:Sterile alpha motif (SAM) domain-containing protein n=1 Tax=Zea mays TaxID=4577 RepID=A0A1D6J5D7_MAIZE|nr:Sterile alpha motif (SAM) domain-containing protein [Zea mays]
MYSDQISTGRKRSIHDRLDGDLPAGTGAGGRVRHTVSKRQRQIDEKWKHDLYREDDEPASNPKDLRLKLQRRSSQQSFTSTRSSGVRDLREKLSGIMHPQPSNADPKPKPKPVSEVVNISRRQTADEMPARQSKRAPKQTSLKKTSQPKVESPLSSFLSSLGLEKYSITFQAEEVDMAALRHMTESDLKALGIPMGPRKKIILALEPRA